MYRRYRLLICLPLLFQSFLSCAQPLNKKEIFTRQDTLRGSNGPGRDWWDVTNYNINITPDYISKRIRGQVTISYRVPLDVSNKYMQIDLQEPMQIDSIKEGHVKLTQFSREGNVYIIDLSNKKFQASFPDKPLKVVYLLTIYFSGKPRDAVAQVAKTSPCSSTTPRPPNDAFNTSTGW